MLSLYPNFVFSFLVVILVPHPIVSLIFLFLFYIASTLVPTFRYFEFVPSPSILSSRSIIFICGIPWVFFVIELRVMTSSYVLYFDLVGLEPVTLSVSYASGSDSSDSFFFPFNPLCFEPPYLISILTKQFHSKKSSRVFFCSCRLNSTNMLTNP